MNTEKQVWRGRGGKDDDPAFRLQQYVDRNGDLSPLQISDLASLAYTITGPDGVESSPTTLTVASCVSNTWNDGDTWPANKTPGFNVEVLLAHTLFTKPAGYENKTVTFTVRLIFVLAGSGRQWAEDFSYQVY